MPAVTPEISPELANLHGQLSQNSAPHGVLIEGISGYEPDGSSLRSTGAYGLRGLPGMTDEILNDLEAISQKMTPEGSQNGINAAPSDSSVGVQPKTKMLEQTMPNEAASPLTIESSEKTEVGQQGIITLNDSEAGSFGIFQQETIGGPQDKPVDEAASIFKNSLRDQDQPAITTPEELKIRAHQASMESGIDDSTSKLLLASVEQVGDEQYLVWVNEGAGRIYQERMEQDKDGKNVYSHSELKSDIGVMELKDEDGYVICSEAIAGSVKNNLTDEQVAAAFDGDDSHAIADNFVSLGEDNGDNAAIALDIYNKSKQDDTQAQYEKDQLSANKEADHGKDKKVIKRIIGAASLNLASKLTSDQLAAIEAMEMEQRLRRKLPI